MLGNEVQGQVILRMGVGWGWDWCFGERISSVLKEYNKDKVPLLSCPSLDTDLGCNPCFRHMASSMPRGKNGRAEMGIKLDLRGRMGSHK